MSDPFDDFADAVREILAREGQSIEAVWSIGPHLRELATQPDIEDLIRDRTEPDQPTYRDPEGAFVVGRARFDAGHTTPVHSHPGWGLLCLLSGEDRYTSWRRDGRRFSLVHDHHLRPGDLAHWFTAPYNVHRQSAGPDETTELVLHMGDGRRVEQFDLETGEATPAPRPESG